LYEEYKKLKKKKNKRLTPLHFLTGKGVVRERIPGLDDNLNIDPEMPQNLEANLIQLPSSNLGGDTNNLFLQVDFEDKPHTQLPERFKKLLFSQGDRLEQSDYKLVRTALL
jgi:hypothetical protein